MEIIARGTAAAGRRGSDRQSLCFPSVCVLPSGRWLVGCRAAPTKTGTTQTTLLTWSDDRGKTWCAPAEPPAAAAPPTIGGRPGRFRAVACTPLGGTRVLATLSWVDHSDPALPYFNEATQGLLDSRLFTMISEDDGQTWSPPRQVDTTPYDQQPTPITGPSLVMPDGRWACQFELNKSYEDPAPWRHGSVMTFSEDQGATWGNAALITRDPANRIFYWDQRPSVLANGTILNLFWTYDNEAAKYLNIHACESADCGRTWSPLWDSGVPGQPAPPVSLPDGRIAMAYVDRELTPQIKMRLSADGGRTWPAKTEVVVHVPPLNSQTWKKSRMQDAWNEMGNFSLGLPATARTADGEVLVVYYAGPERDVTNIEWALLRPRRASRS